MKKLKFEKTETLKAKRGSQGILGGISFKNRLWPPIRKFPPKSGAGGFTGG
jgi:hypothetical protein